MKLSWNIKYKNRRKKQAVRLQKEYFSQEPMQNDR